MGYEDSLREIVLRDERYIVMTAENRAALRTISQQLGERFVDTGIAEQALVGAATGLALRGRTPVVHALATFLTMRAYEFVRTDVGIGNLPVKLVGGIPGFLSDGNGPTHQALEDVALMRGIPNVGVFCPADDQDLTIGLEAVLASPRPFYIRHNPLPAVVDHNPRFDIGKAEVVSEGSDVTLLVYGMLFREAYAARSLLEADGMSVRLLNMRTLKPVDEQAILSAAQQTRLLVTIEDHFLTGGLFSIVSETLVRGGTMANVLPLALENRWFRPGLLADVVRNERFGGEQIAERIWRTLAAGCDSEPVPVARPEDAALLRQAPRSRTGGA